MQWFDAQGVETTGAVAVVECAEPNAALDVKRLALAARECRNQTSF